MRNMNPHTTICVGPLGKSSQPMTGNCGTKGGGPRDDRMEPSPLTSDKKRERSSSRSSTCSYYRMAITGMPKWTLVDTVRCHSVLYTALPVPQSNLAWSVPIPVYYAQILAVGPTGLLNGPPLPAENSLGPPALPWYSRLGLAMCAGQISSTGIMQMKIGMVETSYSVT